MRSARSLAPALQALLAELGWRPADVELVAVTVGPGSFTGLRVGVTTAKVFAYAAGAEVLGVDTLETIAAGVPAAVDAVSIALDAQRGDVVAQPFERASDGWLAPAGPARLVPWHAWLESLPQGAIVAGPALATAKVELPHGITALDAQYWAPRAAQVCRVAYRHYLAGRRDSLWDLVPVYSRRAAAEEKWDAKGK